MSRPVIAVTMGDPAGVGPEICLRALAEPRVRRACVPVIVGCADVLRCAADAMNLRLPRERIRREDLDEGLRPAAPAVLDIGNMAGREFIPGRVNADCGRIAYACIAYAIDRTMAGMFDAMATGPVSKAALAAAGARFTGHTEMLESLTRSRGAVMMLTSRRVTVSLVTTHIALKDVPGALKRRRIEYVIRVTHDGLRRMLGRAPRLAVLGLNCHAGEGGLFGTEEEEVIIPAVRTVRAERLLVDGPLPPDTAFTESALRTYDAHVCMYHDQALIPFKTLSFKDGVNVTLGIPIVRTSVDHGTAFDIAWQGKADHSSLVAALLLAARLARSRGEFGPEHKQR